MIKYSLYPSNFNPAGENCHALVQSAATLSLARVIKVMIERRGSATEAGATAVLKDFFDTVVYLLLYGFRVSTPLFSIGLSIQGAFADELDSFDPKRHQLTLVLTPTRKGLSLIQQQAQLQKQSAKTRQPQPLQYINPNNGDNRSLTPGGGGQILGDLLSFDQADPNQGIFLVAADGSSTHVEVVMRNTPRDLIFLVPAGLSAGEYRLEVRAQFGASLRTGRLAQALTVG